MGRDQLTHNRERLVKADAGRALMAAILMQARDQKLLSDEHFSVDGTLIEAWARQKSFQRKDGEPPADGGSHFRGEPRSNDPHAWVTDPDARSYRKDVRIPAASSLSHYRRISSVPKSCSPVLRIELNSLTALSPRKAVNLRSVLSQQAVILASTGLEEGIRETFVAIGINTLLVHVNSKLGDIDIVKIDCEGAEQQFMPAILSERLERLSKFTIESRVFEDRNLIAGGFTKKVTFDDGRGGCVFEYHRKL